jgi:hypothetical protein
MVEATNTERGRKPLHVATLIATAVVSAFVLLMAAAGIAQTTVRRPRCDVSDFARRVARFGRSIFRSCQS